MSIPSRVRTPLTLEQFLKLPDIDEHPAREYIDGKVEVKVAAQKKHCMIQLRIIQSLNDFAEPSLVGMAFPELRCTERTEEVYRHWLEVRGNGALEPGALALTATSTRSGRPASVG